MIINENGILHVSNLLKIIYNDDNLFAFTLNIR